MKKLLILILVLTGIGNDAFAEEKLRKEKNGDKYYFVYSFEKAIESYTSSKRLTVEGQRRLAKSYDNLDQDIKSEEAYAKLTSSSEGVLPEDYYEYAMVLKANGKIDQSNMWMNKFADSKPDDLRAKDYTANKGKLAEWSKDDGKYKVQHLDVNTDAEDFAPSYYKDKIVFTSNRTNKINARRYNWDGKPFLNMYVSDMDGVQMKAPGVFDKSLNGKMHDGGTSFNKEGTFMAFTTNNYDTKRKDRIVELQIQFSTYKDGKWSKPEAFVLNNPDYSVGHPSLSADGNTMYFTSDMPGGYGGADLYRVTKDGSGAWGKAENLGNTINTEGDELFPFYEEKNGVLFFASDGRFGLGGLDIFITAVNGNQFGRVVNAGAPLNTPYDDFAVIVDDKLGKGYFSSNRTGGSGDDDIYSVDILRLDIGKKIEGIAKDKNGNPIPVTVVTLLNDKGDVVETLTTKDDGAYFFFVDSDKNFKLTGKKSGYVDGETTVNTSGKEYIVKADVTLLKKEEVVAEAIKEGADLGKIAEFNNIYFDLNKYEIRPDAEPELDKIVKIMNDYPNMVVELSSHTDCRESKAFNQVLSDNRANASVNYIKKRITNPSRITGKGYSETRLVNGCSCDGEVVSDCSEADHQKNRRTEFIIKKK
ncbi:MAG: OmpA family protein [Bacteroidota bacterium]|nr:OmpA family protein [Bacteroidota bacterium]